MVFVDIVEVFLIRCVNFVAHEIFRANGIKVKGEKHVSVCICKVNAGGNICVRGSVIFGDMTR